MTRQAGRTQGVVLLLMATLPVMGIVLIAPVLPRFLQHFHDTPGAVVLVPLALTVPALCIAIFSPGIGVLADRFGRRRLLIASLPLYAVCGIAPVVLDSLSGIIATRVGVGIAEAAIMTCSTTLIGDYFGPGEREKWLSNQTVLAAFSATVLFAVGGALGQNDWRGPFWLYAVSLLLLAALLMWTWEQPRRDSEALAAATIGFPWSRVIPMCALTLFVAVMFYVIPVQSGFILSGVGIQSPATIGLFTAIANLAVMAGAFTFRIAGRAPVSSLLCLGLLLGGGGMVGLAHGHGLQQLTVAALVNEFGCGLLLPALLAWAMRGLPYTCRARGTSSFMTSFFLGQFVSPLVMVGLGARFAGLPGAFQLYGIASVCVALITGAVFLTRRRAVSAGVVAI